jgi:hypothetical protein
MLRMTGRFPIRSGITEATSGMTNLQEHYFRNNENSI